MQLEADLDKVNVFRANGPPQGTWYKIVQVPELNWDMRTFFDPESASNESQYIN